MREIRGLLNELGIDVNVVAPDQEHAFGSLSEILARHADGAELRRIDRVGVTLQATYLIPSPDDAGLEALIGLGFITWSASFTFLEMQRYWRDELRVGKPAPDKHPRQEP